MSDLSQDPGRRFRLVHRRPSLSRMMLPGVVALSIGGLLLLDPGFAPDDGWRLLVILTLIGIVGPFILFGFMSRPLPDQWIELRGSHLFLPPSAFSEAPLDVALDDVQSIYARLERDGMLWIETSVRTFTFPLRLFESPSTAALLVQSVRDRLRELPNGEQRIERIDRDMRIAERRSGHLRTTLVAIGLLAASAVITGLSSRETTFGLVRFGANVGFLVREGELFRLVASLFLHERVQLGFVLVGLGLSGAMVERLLGASGAAVVMMVAGLLGALAAQVGGQLQTFGASPIIFGLMGAAAYVTYQHRDRIPMLLRPTVGSWIILGAFTLPVALFQDVDFGSNMGGLVAGVVTGALLTGDGSRIGRESAPWQVTAALGLVYAGSLAWAAAALASYPRSLDARVIERHLELDRDDHYGLNKVAWELVIDPAATREELRLAEVAARRAVDRSPDVEAASAEDTLATALYRNGRIDEAVGLQKQALAKQSDRVLASQLARFLRALAQEVGRAEYRNGKLELEVAPAVDGAAYGIVIRGEELSGLVTFPAKAGDRSVALDAPWMEGSSVIIASLDEGRTIEAKSYEMDRTIGSYP